MFFWKIVLLLYSTTAEYIFGIQETSPFCISSSGEGNLTMVHHDHIILLNYIPVCCTEFLFHAQKCFHRVEAVSPTARRRVVRNHRRHLGRMLGRWIAIQPSQVWTGRSPEHWPLPTRLHGSYRCLQTEEVESTVRWSWVSYHQRWWRTVRWRQLGRVESRRYHGERCKLVSMASWSNEGN